MVDELNVGSKPLGARSVAYDAALRYHGSWRAALTAAGVNLANVSRPRPDNFDREAMIVCLRDCQAAGQTLV